MTTTSSSYAAALAQLISEGYCATDAASILAERYPDARAAAVATARAAKLAAHYATALDEARYTLAHATANFAANPADEYEASLIESANAKIAKYSALLAALLAA